MRAEALDGGFVERGRLVLGGRVGGPVARAAAQDFLAQPAVLVDLQHVDRDVRRRQALDPVQRFAPSRFGLAGEAGDEVDIDVGEAGRAQQVHFAGHRGGGVAAAGAPDFEIDEGLHAERDAVDAALRPRARGFGGEGAGRGLDGGFGPGPAGDGVEQRPQRIRGEVAGRAAAQVDGFRPPRPCVAADLRQQRLAVARLRVAREDARGEVAVGALLRAKGIGDVDSRHEYDCSEGGGRGVGGGPCGAQ